MRLLSAITVICLSLAWVNSAKAQVDYQQVSSYAAEQQANNPNWQRYTSRQRAIATAIAQITATYYGQTAQSLPVTPETVALVMQAIEAEPSEAAFVCDRMYAQRITQTDINTVDTELEQMHQQVQQLGYCPI